VKKKIILGLLLVMFSLLIPKKAMAYCLKSNFGFCSQGIVECKIDSTLYCCDTQEDCDDRKLSSANPPTTTTTNVIFCDGDTGISTAIGCIHALGNESLFLSDLLKWATGIGGGIAFLLILYAGFMIMTASGNPERLKAGQELLTSAIAGLILLIFSVFILKFIGIDILGLCKFGFGADC
jgi:hypothetical protein